MSGEDPSTGSIAVYGATGYTGTLVAQELARRGIDHVLSGRSAEKLDVLAQRTGATRTQAASIEDSASLEALLQDCTAVIDCAGPFTDLGEPVVRAAIATGTHYLDTTGEQPYIRRVLEEFGPEAKERGVALVPAMGFDYVPGDLIAAKTCEGLDDLEEVVLAYAVSGFGATRGTLRSALLMLGGGDVEWRDGALRAASQKVGRGRWDFPDPIGRQRMTRYPAGEQVMVPRHVSTRRVTTLLSATATVPARMAPVVVPAMTAAQPLLRTPLRRAMHRAIGRLPEGPSEADRRASRFLVECVARGPGGERRGRIRGNDVYGLTAFAIVEGAVRTTSPSFDRAGGLSPAQAFEPDDLLGSLAEYGVSWELES